jgi:hypothetical protein
MIPRLVEREDHRVGMYLLSPCANNSDGMVWYGMGWNRPIPVVTKVRGIVYVL